MLVMVKHSWMQRARMIKGRTINTAKWFVCDINVREAYTKAV
jgi:hypothetical protein